MKRNPTCGMTIKRPFPGGPRPGTPVEPVPTRVIKEPFPGGPHFGRTPTPTADSKKPFPGAAVTPSSREPSSPETDSRLRAARPVTFGAHLDRIEKRAGAARKEALHLRIPKDMPAAAHESIERLSSRRAALAQALDTEATRTYRKALESFASLSRESLTDGSYEKARRAAQDGFATAVIEARLRQLQEARRDLAEERKRAASPRLAAYLAGLDVKYARAERDLKEERASRTPGSMLRADLLPKSLLATTVSRGK